MADESKNQNTPKLRFPKFREPWEDRSIGDFLVESRIPGSDGFVAKKITVKLWGKGVYEKIEALKGSENTRYFKRRAGQFIYSKLDFLNQAFGIIPKQLDGYESTVDLPCFDISDGLDSRFLVEYVQRPNFYKKYGDMADGGRKAKRIQVESFLSFPLAVPSPAEQRKIAECLTSLGELIAGQERKVEALRAHKKGLMQQLFPREGETLPRYRFPEFRNASEWTERRLGDLGSLVSGLTYSPGDVRDDGLLVLRSSNIQDGRIALDDCVYVRSDVKGANLSRPNDILICVRNGSKSLIGKNAIIPAGLPVCTNGAFMTVFRAPAPHFVHVLLQTKTYQRQVAADLGATINSINGSQLLKYRFNVPEAAEQQRIAACLSSLDARIAAEAAALAALRQHKKGLMQRLFPSGVEEQ